MDAGNPGGRMVALRRAALRTLGVVSDCAMTQVK